MKKQELEISDNLIRQAVEEVGPYQALKNLIVYCIDRSIAFDYSELRLRVKAIHMSMNHGQPTEDAIVDQLLGMDYMDASELCESNGLLQRIVVWEGEPVDIDPDFNLDRINVIVYKRRIVRAYVG